MNEPSLWILADAMELDSGGTGQEAANVKRYRSQDHADASRYITPDLNANQQGVKRKERGQTHPPLVKLNLPIESAHHGLAK